MDTLTISDAQAVVDEAFRLGILEDMMVVDPDYVAARIVDDTLILTVAGYPEETFARKNTRDSSASSKRAATIAAKKAEAAILAAAVEQETSDVAPFLESSETEDGTRRYITDEEAAARAAVEVSGEAADAAVEDEIVPDAEVAAVDPETGTAASENAPA